MTEVIERDIDGLMGLIGQDITEDNLNTLRAGHPSAFYMILYKIFSWLHSLAGLELTNGDTPFKINMYDYFF